ncbi:multidrug effflux MFS transporter [Massilia yuzhufengensis]|uniref:Bcr/CflA family efflux transporter n=1 Tax=Massilia yuzhufengensis TaxID=1164594 RepID=A0A1I1J325_9BURK|nr:multidrug effflux MFS transporter [Massilia yuzhufengensis]SFC40333.1 MFS transporter, DHA1 family, bicyclomycin/chloramphenicol resistance protein [Massilia yuzhufengensis]
MGPAATAAPGRFGITLILAGLAMLGPFSINAYLPSFPEMERVLHTDRVALQQTISVYFAAFAFMSLWHGAVSDAYGRRRVVLAGLAVYAAASLGCVFATRVEQLWPLRALQGFSAGAGIVIGRAVVRDLHDGPLARRMMSQVVMLYGVAPAIAPLAGGALQLAFGWRSVFLFLALMAAALFLAVALRLPETLPPAQRRPFRAADLVQGYAALLANGAFMAWSLAYALMFGAFFIYVLSAPVFLMQHLGLGETDFLWLFGPATLGLVGGSALAGRMAVRWSVRRTLLGGFGLMAAATLYNLAVCLAAPPEPVWYVLYVAVFNIGMSLAIPTLAIRALDCVPARRGMGSSVQLFAQTGFNAFIAAVLAPLLWGSLLSLALGAAALFVCAGLGTLLAARLSK